jgi:Na+/H+ antiporter NhaD/arsenite permease-like protein
MLAAMETNKKFACRAAAMIVAGGLPALGHCAEFDGRALAPVWGAPFAGLLLCIALMPLLAEKIWHHHYGKIAAAWALAFLLPFTAMFGLQQAAESVVHVAFGEYLPFVILITALFTVAGGIYIRGNLHGTPSLNAGILVIGAVLASLMGTTGASMLLIRPLIRANDNRRHKAHIVVFFIFIVSNAGGSLTPLGDPPLFLGFLQGVDFFWTLREILPETFFLVASLVAIFYAIDSFYWRRREERLPVDPTPDTRGIGFEGARNFWLLGAIVGLVLLSGIWQTRAGVEFMGLHIGLPGLVRDIGLLAVIWLSLRITPAPVHEANHFSWGPMQEVAKLFAGIFVTIVPVIAMLRAGVDGPFGAIVAAVTHPDGTPNPAMYFWASGALSSFLDNAPTYLVFFNTAGGDAQLLMTSLASTLAAISTGSVFMGANSYIGNAPNLMVKAIAEHRGVRMPSFFGYMAWSICVLIPLFILMTLVWYR